MTNPSRPRYRLLAPLIYLAAVLLLIEDWFWDTGARLADLIRRWPPLRALEGAIARLPPWGALGVFALPALLLFPLKIVALYAVARGHWLAGLLVVLLAKLVGAAAVARIYILTLPRLLQVGWFARWQARFMALKTRWIGYLRDRPLWRRARARLAALRRRVRAWLPHRLSWRARRLRRFIAQRRARRP